MTDQAHIPNTRRQHRAAPRLIDFSIHHERSLVIFVPLTPAAEDHAGRFFAGAMRWGGGLVVEHRFAADIVGELFNEGFRLALDGREIVPAGSERHLRRARQC